MTNKDDLRVAAKVYNHLLEGDVDQVSDDELKMTQEIFDSMRSFLWELQPDFYLAALEANRVFHALSICKKQRAKKGLTSCPQ